MEKHLKIKNNVISLIRESDETFFYLAPDIINSVNNANLDIGKGVFKVGFDTTDGRKMSLTVHAKNFHKWEEENKDSKVIDFLTKFIASSKFVDDDEEMLDEIVDEFGNLMPDEEKPSNANFAGIGKSKFSTDKVIKQTIPKSKRSYGDMGLGIVTWLVALMLCVNCAFVL